MLALMVVLALVGGVVFLAIFVSIRVNQFKQSQADRYAAMQVGMTIIDHLDATGRWPTGWDDLKPHFDARTDGSPNDTYFAEIQHRVRVDWSVDPLTLLAGETWLENPAFPVVWCVSGEPAGPTEFHDANHMIHQYLQ